MLTPNKHLSVKISLVFVLFIILGLYYFHNLKAHSFHIDEFQFTRISYYYDLFFIKKDFKDARWYSKGSPNQPKVGPYIYGLTLHLNGINDLDEYFQDIRFSVVEKGKISWWREIWWTKLDNLSDNLALKMEPVWQARKVAVLFSLGAFVLLFLIAFKIRGMLFALLATSILGVNTLMFDYGRRAMTDSMQLFFFFGTLYLSLLMLKSVKDGNSNKTLFLSLLIGLSIALGVGVKISGIIIIGYLVAYFFLLLYSYGKSKSAKILIFKSFIVILVSFFVTFYILHPYIYKNTFNNFISIFTDRIEYAEEYQISYPGSAIRTSRHAFRIIVDRTLLPEGLFTNFKVGKLPVDLLLFVIGFFLITKEAYIKLKNKEIAGELLLFVWTTIVIVGLVFYLKNNWPRYFLPTVSVIIISQAYAITMLIFFVKKRYKQRLLKMVPRIIR